jgi:hypothetical protein
MQSPSVPEKYSIVEDLGKVFHYLIHEKSIMQYFHELRYTMDKVSFMELAARALLEARRDRDSGETNLYIPNSNEVVEEVSRMGDDEFKKFMKELLILAAGYDPSCKKCRERGG